MSPELVWTRGAESDLCAIYQELEEFNSDSGERLVLLIDASLQLLRQFPEMAPVYAPPIRRLVLHQGRYGLFYTIEHRRIILHAVADLRSGPDVLKSRFRKLLGDTERR